MLCCRAIHVTAKDEETDTRESYTAIARDSMNERSLLSIKCELIFMNDNETAQRDKGIKL